MTPTTKIEFSERALKILKQEVEAIAAFHKRVRPQASSAAGALAAACALLNQRGRYCSVTAEHFDRLDFEGIQIIDALDEHLTKAIRALLKAFIEEHRRTPELKALRFLAEKLVVQLQELPPYPVAYMVLGSLHAALKAFQKLIDDGTSFDIEAIEHAFAHFLLGVVDKYVQTRERPGERHHSDIYREYVVVRRLKCGCGEEKYDVTMQALCHGAKGEPFDRLDLQCKACGARRSVTFDLPFFKDLEKM
ncbi:MAG: hypothetical protein HYY16_01120 [Planctomycetes bacterium]|nr:hypothetical protein [Planctomycetota bacterium]